MEIVENTRFIYKFGKFALDPFEKTLFADGVPMHLPAKEFETLLLLVENNNRALSKEEMMQTVWRDAFVEEGNLAKQISRLRKIFNGDGAVKIETLPKHGYRFSAEINRIFKTNEEAILEKRTVKRMTVRVEDEIEDAPLLALPPKKSLYALRRSLWIFLIFFIALASTFLNWNYWSEKNPRIDSIAVLPLKSLSDEEKNNALSLGLTDALITKIGNLRSVAVRPLSSVQKFDKNQTDALEIGKNLNVDAVLEGTIQQSDNRVRINVRLLRVENGEQIWAEKFEAETAKLFDLEDRLSEQTARALKGKLGIGGNEHLTKRFTTNPQAFDAYLKGRFFWNKRTEADFRKAIEYFNHAVEKDSNYALAYSGLADCYILLGVWGAEKPKEVFPKAEQYAEKALQADAELAEALVSRAFVRWVYDWDFERANADFERAIELDPNYATAHHWYAYFLVSENRPERAIDEIKTARELEGPLNISVNTDIGEIYSWAGRYAEADAALREVLQIEPNYAVARHVLAINLLKQNRLSEAVAEAEAARLLEIEPRVLAVLTYAYAADGKRAEALQTFNELNELSKQKYVSPFSKAIALIGLGMRDAAFAELEKAYEERSDTMAIINVYPLLKDVKNDPRFIKIQRQIGRLPH
ncbi:MAG TPA: FlgO family outer membrane protein [Pyrinomonadaceae bacterium]|nr:FlgO family outer membrane protein [Pyrinomonadaceae bacterium]